jgi:hypothetical protein
MNLAPIAIFTYNRPEHSKKTIDALIKNKLANESEVFIFSDGPRNDIDNIEIKQLREYLDSIQGFKNINIIKRENNWGLAKSIVDGVTGLCNKYGKVIALEDDLVTSPYFLEYMNEALETYKDEKKVMHIAGYFPPIKTGNLPNTFFYNQTNCWGWATWQRAWQYYNNDAKHLHDKITEQNRMKEFNLDGVRPNFEEQLVNNINGKIKTWAIKWQASVFLQNGLCLHSRQSLVQNIGFDSSGDNCKTNKNYEIELAEEKINLVKQDLIENKDAREAVKKFYNNLKPNIWQKIIFKLHG